MRGGQDPTSTRCLLGTFDLLRQFRRAEWIGHMIAPPFPLQRKNEYDDKGNSRRRMVALLRERRRELSENQGVNTVIDRFENPDTWKWNRGHEFCKRWHRVISFKEVLGAVFLHVHVTKKGLLNPADCFLLYTTQTIKD